MKKITKNQRMGSMVASEYLNELGLILLRPPNEDEAVNFLIQDHRKQAGIIKAQTGTLDSIPTWIKRWFC